MPTSSAANLTLNRRQDPLAAPAEQVRILESPSDLPAFELTLARHGLAPLTTAKVEVLQINVGELRTGFRSQNDKQFSARAEFQKATTIRTPAVCYRHRGDNKRSVEDAKNVVGIRRCPTIRYRIGGYRMICPR